MGLKIYKPTSPGRRGGTGSDFAEITKKESAAAGDLLAYLGTHRDACRTGTFALIHMDQDLTRLICIRRDGGIGQCAAHGAKHAHQYQHYHFH